MLMAVSRPLKLYLACSVSNTGDICLFYYLGSNAGEFYVSGFTEEPCWRD